MTVQFLLHLTVLTHSKSTRFCEKKIMDRTSRPKIIHTLWEEAICAFVLTLLFCVLVRDYMVNVITSRRFTQEQLLRAQGGSLQMRHH